MVVTDDGRLADKLRSLRNLGFNNQRRFVHYELGWNLRMTNLQAALGIGQLERLPQSVERKRAIGSLYQQLLGNSDRILLPQTRVEGAENIYWVFGMVLSDRVPFDAQEMMKRLTAKGIGTRPFFWPIYEQPVLRNMGYFSEVTCPAAENIARRGFYVPSGLALTDAQIEEVAQAVQECLS